MPPSAKDRAIAAKVSAEQANTALASRNLRKATREASKQLTKDVDSILDVYTRKGGFSSKAEAKAYMDGFVKRDDIDTLIATARKLPEPERTKQLTRLSTPAYAFRMSRKEAIDQSQKMHSKILDEKYKSELSKTAKDAMDEATKRTAYDVSKTVGTAIDFSLPNDAAVDQTLRGAGVYDKVKLFTDEEMKEVKAICTKGFLDGHSYKDVAKDVEAFTAKESYKCTRLVRTTMAQAAVDAEVEELKELDITEYEIVCTYDERTCPECSQYDGKQYTMGKGPLPTFHPNCRCTVSRVLTDKDKQRIKKAARDKNGKTIKVSAEMSYKEWLELYGSDAKKKEVLDFKPTKKFEEAQVKKTEPKPAPVKVEAKLTPMKKEQFPDAFSKTPTTRKNTEKFINYINENCKDADPKVMEVYSRMNSAFNLENGATFKISYSNDSAVGTTQSLYDGSLEETVLKIPKLDGDDIQGAVDTTLHEEMHMMDMLARKDPRKAGSWFSENFKPLEDAINEYAIKDKDGMSSEVKDLFEDFSKAHDTIQAEERVSFEAACKASRARYDAKEISFDALSKEWKKAEKAYYENVDRRCRNYKGGGINALQDIYDALSEGKFRDRGIVKYGHGSKYYRSRDAPGKEIVANYGTLAVAHPELLAMLRRDKPNLVKALDAMMDGMLKVLK